LAEETFATAATVTATAVTTEMDGDGGNSNGNGNGNGQQQRWQRRWLGTSSVVTSLRISSIGTSPVAADSCGCPRPASSLAIAMPAVLGAIPSLHPRHEKQRLLFFSELFMWLHYWHCHEAAARAADSSFGIPL
jgi:hypothetical protein